MSRHPRSAQLIALSDGELALAYQFRVRLHLTRCSRCRRALGDLRAERAAVHAYLGEVEYEADLGEAWARLQVRSGTSQRWSRAPRRGRMLTYAALALLGLLSAMGAWDATHRQFLTRLEALPTRTDLAELRETRRGVGDTQFIAGLLGLARSDSAHVLMDTCCADHDGEGPADDGLYALAIPSRGLTVLVTYDDADGNRALSLGDLVRSASRAESVDALWSVRKPVPLAVR
jgi:hypothetical protein